MGLDEDDLYAMMMMRWQVAAEPPEGWVGEGCRKG